MAARLHSTEPKSRAISAALDATNEAASRFATASMSYAHDALRHARVALKAMQKARMEAVLSEMSDEQLAEIGIGRPDIPAYATTLLVSEKDEAKVT